METKYESGKLHGVYRCRKRNDLMKKVPHIEKMENPDVTGIILAGIMNYGNCPDVIRMMAHQCIGDGKLSIPYDKRNLVKKKFVKDVIIGKLRKTNGYSVESLVRSFYDFMEMPTDTTKALQAASDIRDINRYLNCEHRTPQVIGEPVVHLCGAEFVCQQDFIFFGMQKVVVGRHKEGKKYVTDTEDMFVVESVKILPGKPQVKQNSKVLDGGTASRLELYVMLKATEEWCRKHEVRDALLKASYYYLQKDCEDDKNYSSDFFGKGGNVVSLQTKLESMDKMDAIFLPQLRVFLEGESVDQEKCKTCQSRALCNYKDSIAPLTEEEKPMPKELPVLSKDQAKAANALEGNIRVVATAGSGKTTTMSYRIMNLLKSGVAPEKIGCFTFTNAGAAEMLDRIRGFCKLAGIEAEVDKLTISTIHSFGDSLLKQYYGILGYSKPTVLINEIQKTKIIEKILSEDPVIPALADKYKNFYMDLFNAKGILALMKGYFEQIMNGISMNIFMKNNCMEHATASAVYSMYNKYLLYKKEECLIEHSDQERGVLELLKKKPDLFEEVGIEHISVDEYQDTSNIQFEIIHAMKKAKCVKSLFVVGDDDQSIYGFRDANVQLIQNFFSMIGEGGQDIHLMENRRSTAQIVAFADKVIGYNEERIPKNPVSVKGLGDEVTVHAFSSREEEQEFITTEVARLIQNGTPCSDIAVLAPTNSELLTYADILGSMGIVTVSINPEPILDNTRVSGAVSLVKFIMDNNEFHGMNYIIIRDGGKIGSDEEIEEEVKCLETAVRKLHTSDQLFELFRTLDPKGQDEIFQKFIEDICTVKENAIVTNKLYEIFEYILDFERFGTKETARKEQSYSGVVLSTMHSSKGKEWPIVFCSVSKMHTRTMRVEDIPEKNRLLFVACTRAMKKLYVTGADIAFNSAASGGVQNMFLRECMDSAAKVV